MFMTPRESLAPLVLPLERESYLPYIKKIIKKILQIIDPFHDYNIYTTSSKDLLFIYNDFTVHTLSTICDKIDASKKLNKNLFVISLELILSLLL